MASSFRLETKEPVNFQQKQESIKRKIDREMN